MRFKLSWFQVEALLRCSTTGEVDSLNAHLGAGVALEVAILRLSFGLSYIMALNIDNGLYDNTGSGLLGAGILFWL